MGKFCQNRVLDIPEYCAINIHASLLPKYRGPAPIQWAVINGEEKTGVCTMVMTPGLDTGDILLCKETVISPEDTGETLHDRLATLGAETLIDTMGQILSGEIRPVSQNHSQASYAPLLNKKDGHIPWEKPAQTLFNFIRGMTPWPGAFSFHGDKRLKIFSALVIHPSVSDKPGTVLTGFPDELRIATGDGALSILEIQGASGKKLSIGDFLRGYNIQPGDMLT